MPFNPGFGFSLHGSGIILQQTYELPDESDNAGITDDKGLDAGYWSNTDGFFKGRERYYSFRTSLTIRLNGM